jgi:hypothetical protein
MLLNAARAARLADWIDTSTGSAASRHFVGKLLVHEGFETLLERVAAETIVQVSGWDPNLATELSRYSPEDLVAGITTHPTEQWMKQMARNVTMAGCGALGDSRYLLHDRDTKYTASFPATIESVHVKTLRLPARSPNLNAYSERWVRSAKEECLSKLILFGERSLRRAMREYVAHYHAERNHQGKSNVLLFPSVTDTRCDKAVECRERLGGLLRYYQRDAA